jgi:glycosyltransferase involved in cell wall biosynthesis
MKIVFVTAWYSEGMGYIENCLPRAMAKLGHDVHIITSTAQVYYNHEFYEKAYQKYLGDPIQPVGSFEVDNVHVHRLPFFNIKSKIILKGLILKVNSINPDVVTTFEHVSIDTLKLSFLKIFKKYKLFTSNHAVLSVYPTAKNWSQLSFTKKAVWFFTEWIPGRFTNLFIEKCFAVTIDAAQIAVEYRGVSKNKVKVTTLGVDTDAFHPNEIDKLNVRKKWNFADDEIVCIFTGKLIVQKQPVLVAQAIAILAKKGYKIKGFFVAEGPLKDEVLSYDNCQIIDLQPFKELPSFFRMADIAIFAGEESSSQLDAVASGTCLILTDNIKAYSEIEALNNTNEKPRIVSRLFKNGELDDLVFKLESLFDKNYRQKLADAGVKEIQENYSWHKIAMNRIEDYNS